MTDSPDFGCPSNSATRSIRWVERQHIDPTIVAVTATARHDLGMPSSHPHALRTETALAVLAGQLDLLRQRGSVAP